MGCRILIMAYDRAAYERNKKSYLAATRRWQENNRERDRANKARWRATHKTHRRDVNLRYNHGITLEEYNVLLKKQGGRCAICRRPPNKKGTLTSVLAVDHNHKTGALRGLLCNICNRYIGYIKESKRTLDRAKKYL